MDDLALWVGAVVAASAAAGALMARDPRHRVAAMALALAVAPILIAADHWDDARFRDLRDSPGLLAAASLAGASLLAGLAALIRRLPAALPVLAVAALPFRIPVEAGGDSANLLLPLYAVIAAGVLAQLATFGRASKDDRRTTSGAAILRWLPAALAGWVLLYALQAAYSDDLSKAVENLSFFLVPFAVLAGLLLRVDWTPRLLVLLLLVVVAEGALFALIGFAQFATRGLFWNDAIIAANEVHAYFRVNSLFWDPNIFGRYLAMTVIAVTAAMLWSRSPRSAAASGAAALMLLAALGLTFSQSSLIALFAGLAVLAALRWSARWTAAACLAAVIAGLAWIAVSDGSVQTSGRDELIEGGLELAGERPVWGHGSGSFQSEFERRSRFGDGNAEAVSHTEPVTVAAEQGAVGVAAYLAVISLSIAALAHRIRPWAPGLRRGGAGLGDEEGRVLGTARAALLAALVAMVVHSLSYAAFFTDPITWVLLGVGLAMAGRERVS